MVERQDHGTVMRLTYLLGVLLLASPVLGADAAQVRISQADGTVFGVLTSSSDEETLSLELSDGRVLKIGSCGNEQKANAPSPDGIRTAAVVEWNCGATVDFATRVTVTEGQHSVLLIAFAGQPHVSLAWKSSTALEVHHSKLPTEAVFATGFKPDGISVTLMADLETVPPSKGLDFSSFNYGATGRAAGMPREMLLRLAGWSQQASGLYRQEWGTWSGSPPYGDDPVGAAQVLGGIEYYEKKYVKKP